MTNDVVAQKVLSDLSVERTVSKYQRKIKKLKKKHKKSIEQVRALECEVDCLNNELKNIRKKHKQLKKGIQMERFEHGENPFVPYAKGGKQNKRNKQEKKNCFIPTIQYIALPSTAFSTSVIGSEKNSNIIDGDYRDLCQGNLN